MCSQKMDNYARFVESWNKFSPYIKLAEDLNESKCVVSSETAKGEDKDAAVVKKRGTHTSVVSIRCPFAKDGCKEMIIGGAYYLAKHEQICNFRPIPCIFEGTCHKVVPYSEFRNHLHQHFMRPIYTTKMTTSVVIHAVDFQQDSSWNPKWFNCYCRDFMFMLMRKAPGIWSAWVWFIGDEIEAKCYKANISFIKKEECIGGVYPVHSIRKSRVEIQTNTECFMISDETMKSFSDIRDNVLTNFQVTIEVGFESTLYDVLMHQPSDSPAVNALSESYSGLLACDGDFGVKIKKELIQHLQSESKTEVKEEDYMDSKKLTGLNKVNDIPGFD